MSDDFTYPDDKFILVGKVVKVHGLQGELKIYPYSEQPENIKAYKHLVLTTDKGRLFPPFKVLKCRVQKKFAIVRLDSVVNRDQAEQLIGFGVLLNKDDLPEIDKNSYYWQDLIGKEATTETGVHLGTVKSLFNNGAQDILVIGGQEEYLIPVTRDFLVDVQTEGIIINPPPGLLDINTGTKKK